MWILLGIFAIDILGSVIAIFHMKISIPPVDEVNTRLAKVRRRLALWITGHIERRMEKAYPNIRPERVETREKPEVFAKGCGFYKLFILFVVGAFLGDIVETVFCRYSMGRWMSRSSFVWGPFSIVWGMAIVLATLLLNNFRDRSDGFLFIFGTVVGGAYEYLCSVLTEIVFGKIFWDYSKLPFNLGGRINLLFCFSLLGNCGGAVDEKALSQNIRFNRACTGKTGKNRHLDYDCLYHCGYGGFRPCPYPL